MKRDSNESFAKITGNAATVTETDTGTDTGTDTKES